MGNKKSKPQNNSGPVSNGKGENLPPQFPPVDEPHSKIPPSRPTPAPTEQVSETMIAELQSQGKFKQMNLNKSISVGLR